jgi:nicotinamidase-related amidase
MRCAIGGALVLSLALASGCSAPRDPSEAAVPALRSENKEKVMHIRPRYVRLHTDPGVELAEANYHYRELDWDIPLSETALVCVDCWAWHYSRETLERTEAIMKDKVAPLLAACREHGMLVIHAPASPVVERQPNWVRLMPSERRPQPPWPDSPDWPPADFKSKTGPYAPFAKPAEPQDEYIQWHAYHKRDLHPLARPVGDEPVILNGEELHRLCAQRRILRLFFIGFNTNACIMMRDSGPPAMVSRGYDVILVRDCTTGMETADTLPDLTCTRGTIADIEQFLGYTVTSDQLISALRSARQQEALSR